MAKPKGKRALTKAEAQHRARMRLKIINEKMAEAGIKPLATYMPPVYMQALRAHEAMFHPECNFVKTVIHSTTWLCVAVEEFVKSQAELFPDSELARIYNSREWVKANQLGLDNVALNANIAIYEFERDHARNIS